jgi:hypothetical protein
MQALNVKKRGKRITLENTLMTAGLLNLLIVMSINLTKLARVL